MCTGLAEARCIHWVWLAGLPPVLPESLWAREPQNWRLSLLSVSGGQWRRRRPTYPPPTRLGDCEGSGGLISACRILTVWPCCGGWVGRQHHCPLNVAFLLKQIPRSKQQYERKADIVRVFFIYLFFPLCYYDTAHPGGVVQGCVVCSREYLIFVCERKRETRWLGFYLSCRCLELLWKWRSTASAVTIAGDDNNTYNSNGEESQNNNGEHKLYGFF